MIAEEILKLIGLARRAGKIVIGTEAVIKAINRKKAVLVIFAEDFSPGTKQRIQALSKKLNQTVLGAKQEWGRLWDKEEIGVMVITDRNFANGILKIIESGKKLNQP